ncbi:type VI secretion system baseplate subunit TssK [Sulfurimonas sp.]|uniref:type VI secretion system baseplate subunit TssK n=1 Tax=Sulfurimonas sp. TaxID=2022749 RepID=UPI003D1088D0
MERRVIWKEGLFIRPQHFQQNDRYYAYELMSRTVNSGSNQWGFFELDIDKRLLGIGKVVLNSAQGIMPDGTLFYISNKEESLALDIGEDDYGQGVYLAIPIVTQNSDEVHFEDQENHLTRFSAQTVLNVSNTNAGENSNADMVLAKHDFKLLLEENVNDGYVAIKITNIASVSTGGSVLIDENYIPTFFHLHRSKDLLSMLNEIIRMLTYRVERLADKISNSALQASELGNYLMLQLLNKTLSRFHFYLTQDKIHPQDVFLELTTLAGELAVFMKKEKKLTENFTYKHEEMGGSFNKIVNELKEMLSMVLEESSASHPIEERKYGIHVSQIKDRKMIKTSQFIFAVSADTSTEKIKEILMANLKIGTIETIRELVNYHLQGFKLKALSSPPREIPYRVNNLYFQIELTSENRIELEKSGGFAFHLSAELPNVVYALWSIRSAS